LDIVQKQLYTHQFWCRFLPQPIHFLVKPPKFWYILGSPKTKQKGNKMKKLIILLVIIFSFLFSTTSWGDWNYVVKNMKGSKFYYDKDRIRKSGKFIYFWDLDDYIRPTKWGVLSTIRYTELDCSIFRYKVLKFQSYNKSMGEGNPTDDWTPPDEWRYPKPNSVIEFIYKIICEEHQ
jgi:hypothetical protein